MPPNLQFVHISSFKRWSKYLQFETEKKEACAPFMVIHFCSGLGHLTEKTLKLPQLESCCLMFPEESSLVLIVCHSILGYNFLFFLPGPWIWHLNFVISFTAYNAHSIWSPACATTPCQIIPWAHTMRNAHRSASGLPLLLLLLPCLLALPECSSIMLLPQPCCRLQTNFSFSQKNYTYYLLISQNFKSLLCLQLLKTRSIISDFCKVIINTGLLSQQ